MAGITHKQRVWGRNGPLTQLVFNEMLVCPEGLMQGISLQDSFATGLI